MAEENESILGPKTFTASVKNSGLNDFIFLIDLNQDTCSVSDECVKFIKLPSANFWDAVKTITNVVHPDDQKFFAKCFDELKDKANNTNDFAIECRMQAPSGAFVQVALRGKLIPKANMLTGTICLTTIQKDDVTGHP